MTFGRVPHTYIITSVNALNVKGSGNPAWYSHMHQNQCSDSCVFGHHNSFPGTFNWPRPPITHLPNNCDAPLGIILVGIIWGSDWRTKWLTEVKKFIKSRFLVQHYINEPFMATLLPFQVYTQGWWTSTSEEISSGGQLLPWCCHC